MCIKHHSYMSFLYTYGLRNLIFFKKIKLQFTVTIIFNVHKRLCFLTICNVSYTVYLFNVLHYVIPIRTNKYKVVVLTLSWYVLYVFKNNVTITMINIKHKCIEEKKYYNVY